MVSSRAQVLEAWLSTIGQVGWRQATAQMVAEACGLSNAGLQAVLGDRFDALAAFQDKVADEAALAAVSAGSVRERLFDGIMQGFDHLQAHRAAVLAIRSSRDPGIALLVVCRAGLQIRRLARASGMDLAGARGPLKLAALTALIWQAFAAWRADDSPDMAATMASLDQLLERAERAETVGLSPDLIGLPGLTALFARLRPCGGQSGPVLPPSPGQQAE